MKKPLFVAMGLMFVSTLVNAAEPLSPDTDPTMKQHSPGNTQINKRDENDQTLTPMDQSNTVEDTHITQAIRKEIMQRPLSMDAKNVKIITLNGDVTLRGPVKNKAEKEKIGADAKAVPGVKNLNNELEVQ
ncbi:BON domain-containing protein [Sulfuriferula sp. AH1]|uniref:BON domain-containing protein n=1 Tax=Sulfuriferula sp. AH1 TaxID=1985873 RepID=UPI001CB8F28C|nr:BON domain-containing protein [Sulfuriferula sp. AH1]